ncbi:MAG: hypothetical protein RMM17_09540 [Acidobacteriota bacterium]|nr:hypothetical protein [Blastocatellia bacterium]MDW8412912.1 hypothetical protein [Acidobacteriota bacterium]
MSKLDNLDSLLQEELGKASSGKPTKSLEEQVLERVAPAAATHSLSNTPTEDSSSKDLLFDLLLPYLEDLEASLESLDEPSVFRLRSQLAELLLLPAKEEGIDKTKIFAAVATCLDALLLPQHRQQALKRLQSLTETLNNIRQESLKRRISAVADFIRTISVDLSSE